MVEIDIAQPVTKFEHYESYMVQSSFGTGLLYGNGLRFTLTVYDTIYEVWKQCANEDIAPFIKTHNLRVVPSGGKITITNPSPTVLVRDEAPTVHRSGQVRTQSAGKHKIAKNDNTNIKIVKFNGDDRSYDCYVLAVPLSNGLYSCTIIGYVDSVNLTHPIGSTHIAGPDTIEDCPAGTEIVLTAV